MLSGFTWPDNTARLLKGTTWAAVENQGSGHVVLFLGDPLFRAFWRGTLAAKGISHGDALSLWRNS